MKCVIDRDKLLEGLGFTSGVIERRQSMPILSNVLLQCENETLSLIGSDTEIELTAFQPLISLDEPGKTTVSAHKLLDICRALPSDTAVNMASAENKLIIKAGKSRFSLATLSADEFPKVKRERATTTLKIDQSDLLNLLESTHFCMAQQDVRYYLNGMLFEFAKGSFTTVATDGHRLSLRSLAYQNDVSTQFLVPRKAIVEIMRLLSKENNEQLTFHANSHSLIVESSRFIFVTRLIDARFPDYHRVIPKNCDKTIYADRDTLKQMLQRAAILTNDKYRAVRLQFKPNMLLINASNMEQEEANDEMSIDYSGDEVEIGLNVNYLLDVLNVLPQDTVKIMLTNAQSSVLIASEKLPDATFVIMPMA